MTSVLNSAAATGTGMVTDGEMAIGTGTGAGAPEPALGHALDRFRGHDRLCVGAPRDPLRPGAGAGGQRLQVWVLLGPVFHLTIILPRCVPLCSRSPETTRERLRRSVRSSQSPEPAAEGKRWVHRAHLCSFSGPTANISMNCPAAHRRESSPRAIKKDKSKTRKKHKKDRKRNSSPSGSEGSGSEHSKRGQGSGSEDDEDLQLLMQRAMESAKHRRAESDD